MQQNQNLHELKSLGQEVVLSINTLGVATSSGKIIGTGEDIFHLKTNEISFGIGIHGEKGYREEPFYSSEYLANELLNKLLSQYNNVKNKSFALMINGLGSTTIMEKYIFANDIRRLLRLEGITINFQKLGDFMTSTNMAGISVTLFEIKDKKWLTYLEDQTDAFGWL